MKTESNVDYKVWTRVVTFKCGKTGTEEISAYEENGKYYLRIITCYCHVYTIKHKTYYEVGYNKPYIKEFDNREWANKYFLKCTADGDWKRVKRNPKIKPDKLNMMNMKGW